MDRIDRAIADIQDLIASASPYDRIPGDVYLDAQAVVEWARLGVLEEVSDVVGPIDGRYTRFHLQNVAFNESTRKLADITGRSRVYIGNHLRDLPNLHIDTPLLTGTAVADRALRIQAQIFILDGVTSPPKGSLKHLGESEALAVIERLDPEAVFVTGDRAAVRVAKNLGISVVRPLAFAAALVQNRERVKDMWELICSGRDCTSTGAVDSGCIDRLECADLGDIAAQQGPLSAGVVSALDLLKWMQQDVEQLICDVSA